MENDGKLLPTVLREKGTDSYAYTSYVEGNGKLLPT